MRTSAQARAYVAELRAILVAIGASDGRMEEGSLRVDANVSVHKPGTPFGTRCEIKNVNSLRSVQRAIDYEALRQIELIEDGGTVRQETRHWDEDRGETSTLRSKEQAEDYRYFREPDLVDLIPDAAWMEQVRTALPPLPAARRQHLEAALGQPTEAQKDVIATVVDQSLDDLVTAVVDAKGDASLALSRAANEVAGEAGRGALTTEAFVATVALEQRGELSATQAKTVLAALMDKGGEPSAIAKALGFEAMGDDALAAVVDDLIAAHPDEFQRFRDGDDKVSQFFIGQVMKATKGQANGKAVVAALQARR
jgi:aspartyl-tRNA(Asn)/glutamyl-tRNA(Gln) amidotransferase subunit B